MADINYTTLLGLAQPITGRLPVVWGDVVNAQLTQLLEDAVAGQVSHDVTSGDWTLSTDGGGDPNEARMAVLVVTGTPSVARVVIAPAASKIYFVVNKTAQIVTVKSLATDGTDVPANGHAIVAWDGDDFAPFGSGGSSALEVKDADFTADVGGSYYLDGDITVTLPDTTSMDKAASIMFSKPIDSTPTIEVGAGGAEIKSSNGGDTSITYDANAQLVVIFNGTDWEV